MPKMLSWNQLRNKTLNGKELAELLQITPARVSQLTKENVFHREEDGRYRLVENFHSYLWRTFGPRPPLLDD